MEIFTEDNRSLVQLSRRPALHVVVIKAADQDMEINQAGCRVNTSLRRSFIVLAQALVIGVCSIPVIRLGGHAEFAPASRELDKFVESSGIGLGLRLGACLSLVFNRLPDNFGFASSACFGQAFEQRLLPFVKVDLLSNHLCHLAYSVSNIHHIPPNAIDYNRQLSAGLARRWTCARSISATCV